MVIAHRYNMYVFIPYRTVDNESYLVLAIKHQLQSLVKCLCEKGVDLGTPDTNGNVPLWVALRSKQENIASMLVCTYVRMYMAHYVQLASSASYGLLFGKYQKF